MLIVRSKHPSAHRFIDASNFVQLEKVLALLFVHTVSDSFDPLVKLFLFRKANVNGHRGFSGDVVDGLEHKAEVILVFGFPE